MNYFEDHIGDYAAATAHLTWDEDMAYTRLIRAYYHHEAPIPTELKAACRIARATTPAQRKAVEQVLQEFFTLHADGWHQKRCDAEIARFQDKQAKAKRSADARWNAHRPQSAGNANASPNAPPIAMRTHTEGNAPSLQTPDPDPKKKARAVPSTSPPARAPDRDPAEPDDPLPTAAGRVCRAMRQAGLQAVNPGDPRLLALLTQGVTELELVGVATEAVAKGKGWAWVLTVVQSRRAEAGSIVVAQSHQADPEAWKASRDAVINRGCALGLGPWDEVAAHVGNGPSYRQYRQAVIDADASATQGEAA